MNTAAFSQRYFPFEDYDTIRDVFLQHYPDHPNPGRSHRGAQEDYGDPGLLSTSEASGSSGLLIASSTKSINMAS